MDEDDGNPKAPEEASEPQAAPDPERVAHFRILERLGADALGVVYQAEDESSQRIVALEVLWANVPEENILADARAVAALSHPNLEAIHEVGEENGYVYVAMDLAAGEPLRARLGQGPLPDAFDIAAQIAAGLACAHAAGIAHGTLAPENVFLTEDGKVTIVDLALAKFRVVEEPTVYMAPEQAAGLETTLASDVFSFGMIYHEMLTGRLPAPGDALDPFVAECLAEAPADRPDTAALLGAFDATATDVEAPPARWRWPVAVAAALCFVGILVLLTRHEPTPTTYTNQPAQHFKNPEAASEYAAAMQAMRDDSWNLAQLRLAHVVALEPASGAAHLRLAIANRRSVLGGPSAMRAEYTKYLNERGGSAERDQQLAEALEPLLARPQEARKDAEDRLAKLHERWPVDVEVLDLLTSTSSGDPARQLALADEAARLDAKDGNAHELRGVALEMLDRNDEARAALESSVAVAATSTEALHRLEDLDSSEGRCQDLERHARLFADRNLTPDAALLEAIVANGGGVESFHQALLQLISELPAPLARVTEILARAQLAFAHGDFAETRGLASQAEELLGHDSELSQSVDLHRQARFLLVGEAIATGGINEAARLAKGIAATSDAQPDELWIQRLAAEADSAAFATYQQQRDARAQDALSRKDSPPLDAWYFGYASAIFTPGDATTALAALSRFGALRTHPLGVRDHLAGRALFLAGRIDEAIPYLRRAVASCLRYRQPWLQADAAIDLGDALASKSDHDGACAAYNNVVMWWGNAKPRSVQADKARAARATLHCQN